MSNVTGETNAINSEPACVMEVLTRREGSTLRNCVFAVFAVSLASAFEEVSSVVLGFSGCPFGTTLEEECC